MEMNDAMLLRRVPYSRVKLMGVLVKLENGDIHQVVLSEYAISNIVDVILAAYGGEILVRGEPIRTIDLVLPKESETKNEED
ncbi:TPA: hypothetical protein DCG86_09190 [Candidatus Marinimicrobia bacterium]|nr:hypothetical protein [Candidatus Neomarinimicrobiota bacterium]